MGDRQRSLPVSYTHLLVSYWGNTSGEIALNGDVGVAIDGVDSAT